jgi:uncharacterized protein (UPF0303 family)
VTLTDHRHRADALLAEEQALSFPRFTFADALAVGTLAMELASKPVIVHVTLGELLLFAGAQDGTTPDNQLWLTRKSAVVRRFGRSSLWLHHDLRAKGRSVADMMPGLEPLADHGGAVPLMLGGRAVGIVGVSGLPHEEDHAVAITALRTRLAALAG